MNARGTTPLGHRRYACAIALAEAAVLRRMGQFALARVLLRYASMFSTHPHPCINPMVLIRARGLAHERRARKALDNPRERGGE